MNWNFFKNFFFQNMIKQAEDEFNKLTSELTHESVYSAYRTQLDSLESSHFHEFKKNNSQLITEKCKLVRQNILGVVRANISIEREKLPIAEKHFRKYKAFIQENTKASFTAELGDYVDSEAFQDQLKFLLV